MSIVTLNKLHLSSKISDLLSGLAVATKQLKVLNVGANSEKKKLVVSTNWLNYFNFTEGSKVIESVIGFGKGMTVKVTEAGRAGTKKVYGRDYKNREREALLDIRHQQKIQMALASAQHVHITFEMNCITILPIFEHSDSASIKSSIPLDLKIPLSLEGGVYAGIIDAVAVIKAGYYESVTISCDEEFQSSNEYLLFSLQLRRLGYEFDCINSKQIKAFLKGGRDIPISQFHSVDINLIEHSASIASQEDFDVDAPLSTFLALSSGVDGVCLENEGFQVDSLLEYLPPEARDFKKSSSGVVVHSDKTELGSICAAINCKSIKHVFNEDIFKFKLNNVQRFIKERAYSLLHISLECSDFSNAKSGEDKSRHVDSLESSRDMIFPLIDLLNDFPCPPQTLLLENVKNFYSSVESKLLTRALEGMGYTVYKEIVKAKENDGLTLRSRCYLFATVLNEPFTFPQAQPRTRSAWDDVIAPNLHMLRDVTHTKSVQLAITGGRLRPVNIGDVVVPTIMRSQNRQVKDSVYIHIDNKYYMPSVEMLKMLMSIEPSRFDTSLFSVEGATQFIGQSIDVAMHKPIVQNIKDHIMAFVDRASKANEKVINKFNEFGYALPPQYF
jgi:site-specific DNA-cytosine methylase